VEMVFTRCEAPEGMARLIEQYANMVQPFKSEGAAEGGPVGSLMASAGPEAGGPKPRRNLNVVKMNTKATAEVKK